MTTGPIEPASTEQPTETLPEQIEEAPAKQTAKSATAAVSVLGIAGIATFCALVVVVVGMLAYMKYLDANTKMVTVNIEEIMEAKQLQLASMVTGSSVTDKERGDAYDRAKVFGSELHDALKVVQKECDCVILTSAAVIMGDPIDMTGRVKELVGMAGLDVNVMKRKLEESMKFAPKDAGAQ